MTSAETVREYTVHGMTCDHCVRSVSEEVGAIPGAGRVEVQLASGRLVVGGDVSAEAVRAAVAEAGYEVAA